MTRGAIAGAAIIAALGLVVPGGAVSPPRPSVYYVDPSGNDSIGTGSRGEPWRTISKACASTPGGLGHAIRVNAGLYTEPRTCILPCKTDLRGAGAAKTAVRGSADPLISVKNCMHRANAQTISGLRLDGQNRSAGVFGLRAIRTRGLTITRMVSEGFKGPANAGGGAIDIHGAWNLDLGKSILRNSGNANASACSGTLGLGEIHNSKVHDVEIIEDRGYGVKTSTPGAPRPSRMSNVDFFNLNVQVLTDTCARWNTLAFELYRTDAVNVRIRQSRFNRVLSLISEGGPVSSGYRYRVHNNVFTVPSGNNYAIELHAHSSIIDHNYFDGGIYPVADFSAQSKTGNAIHHNVFDNQSGPTAAMHLTGGVKNAKFYNNTVVLRQTSWRDGVFSLGMTSQRTSTIDIKNNLFVSIHSIGDRLGLGLGAATIDHNGFYHIAARGTNAILADPQLPLTGEFPDAYILPPGSSAIDAGVVTPGLTDERRGAAPDLGAFELGATWSVGPR